MDRSMKEVARRAGVSIATVSHVINGTRYVSPETKEKVLKTIEGLNYVPNSAAQNLRNKKSRMIRIITPVQGEGTSKRLHMGMINAISYAMGEKGYGILFSSMDYEDEDQRGSMLTHAVDGLIIVSPTIGLCRFITNSDPAYPVLFLDYRPMEDEQGCFIYINHFSMLYDAVSDLLVKGGRQSVAFLENDEPGVKNIECNQAYKKAIRDSSRGLDESLAAAAAAAVGNGYAMAERMIEQCHADAIVCTDETLSIGVARYFVEKKPDIPCLIYNQSGWDEALKPIRSIKVPDDKLGRRAAEIMLELMANPEKKDQIYPFRTELTP